MATKPSTVFEWATNEGDAITPSPDSTVRQTGFGKTFVPYQWLNHILNHIGKWIAWLEQERNSQSITLTGHANSISTLFNHYNASEKVKAHGMIVIPFSGFNPAINDGKVDATIEYIIHRHPITGASSLVTLIFPDTFGDPTNATDNVLTSLGVLPATVTGFDDTEINLRPASLTVAPVLIQESTLLACAGFATISTTGLIDFNKFHTSGVSSPYDITLDPSFPNSENTKGFHGFTVTYKAAE